MFKQDLIENIKDLGEKFLRIFSLTSRKTHLYQTMLETTHLGYLDRKVNNGSFWELIDHK